VLGIGPLDGQWIEVAGLAGGRLPTTTSDGWQARLARGGVALAGPAGESVEVNEPEEIRAFGFSPDGATFIIASSPSVVIFRRDTADAGYATANSRPDMRHVSAFVMHTGSALNLGRVPLMTGLAR
jgi:hypothetical protein